MKKLALLFSIIVPASGICFAQTSGFTYQGKLGSGGAPANGTYQFECKLYDRVGVIGDFGNQIGATQTVVAPVQNGIFTMQLDFGAASFVAGQDRWLEIGVRLNGSNGIYTVFDPRQQINSVPFAVRSLNATTADNATKLAGVTAGNYVQTSDTRLSDARTPTGGSANYIQNTTTPQASSNFNINGNGTAGGTLSANAVNAATQYNIGGNRILSNSGAQNLFAGVGAGQNNTAAGNSFFGWSAGSSNTIGTANSFFGTLAGANATTGLFNSFFGQTAGNSSSPGKFNTGSEDSFFGASSGSSNTSGTDNSFFGEQSGRANTEGNENSFFGTFAGAINTQGSNNTFVGLGSGGSNTVESNNTCIGYLSDGSAGITNATAIGANAQVTQSNSLVLGSIINVNNATADTKVGIGTTAPANRLSVVGIADFTGNVGIGTTNPTTATGGRVLDIEGATSALKLVATDANGKNWEWQSTVIGAVGAMNLSNISNGTNPLTIYGNGRVGIGTANSQAPDQTLSVNGDASKAGGGSWLVYSDERLKNIKGSFTPGLKALMQLQPIRYEYQPDNALGIKSTGDHVGFGAQAVQKIIPEAVTKNDKGFLLVNNDPIMWTMLNAIKEQQLQIESQQKQIDGLKVLVCSQNPTAGICKSNN